MGSSKALNDEAPRRREIQVTELTQTQRKSPSTALIGVALAASMLGGIVGGLVGTACGRWSNVPPPSEVRAAAAEQAKWNPYGAKWERLHRDSAVAICPLTTRPSSRWRRSGRHASARCIPFSN